MAFPSNMLPAIDDKTIIINNNNELTTKDIAIGGDVTDLASTRGTFDTLTKGSVDCNTITDQGVYAISLTGTVNGPGFSAKLIVFNGKNSKFTNQMALAAGAGTSGAVRVAYRAKNSEEIWSPWSEGILSGRIGDGITVNNGIISVPEMQGATASSASTTGLVPVATAINRNAVLSGKGEFSYNQYGNILNLTSGMSLIVDAQSNYLMVSTSGNITIMQKNDYYVESNRLITLVFKATATTVLAWPPSWKWLNETKYSPTWGTAGNTLIVEVWILGKSVSADRIVLASAIYNSEDV